MQNSGGDINYVENTNQFEKAKFIMPVYAPDNGYIEKIDADVVGSIAVYLGAGRINQESQIETAAGIVFNKKIGDVVSSGDIIAYIHTNDETKIMGAIRNLEDAFKITNKKVNITSRVVEIL